MALATWRLRRLHLVETGAFNFHLLDHEPLSFKNPSDALRLAYAMDERSDGLNPSATSPVTRPNWSAPSTEPSSNSSASSP